MKEDQKAQSKRRAKKESGELDQYPDAFDDLHRVMLYIHGGKSKSSSCAMDLTSLQVVSHGALSVSIQPLELCVR